MISLFLSNQASINLEKVPISDGIDPVNRFDVACRLRNSVNLEKLDPRDPLKLLFATPKKSSFVNPWTASSRDPSRKLLSRNKPLSLDRAENSVVMTPASSFISR